jgi:hypothetical protein
VYWLRKGNTWTARSRGFDRESLLNPDRIAEAWERGQNTIAVPSTRFITLRESIHRGDPAAAGTWETKPRILALDGGGKRSRLRTVGLELLSCLRPTRPMIPVPIESAPYESIVYDSHFEDAKEQAAL